MEIPKTQIEEIPKTKEIPKTQIEEIPKTEEMPKTQVAAETKANLQL